MSQSTAPVAIWEERRGQEQAIDDLRVVRVDGEIYYSDDPTLEEVGRLVMINGEIYIYLYA